MSIDFNSLEFAEPESRYGPPKATTHRSGRLGFNLSANELLDFEKNKYWKIGRLKMMGNEEVFDNSQLVLFSVDTQDDQTFVAQKSGSYYSFKARRLWGLMQVDYRFESVAFDIDEMDSNGRKYYKLIKRRK